MLAWVAYRRTRIRTKVPDLARQDCSGLGHLRAQPPFDPALCGNKAAAPAFSQPAPHVSLRHLFVASRSFAGSLFGRHQLLSPGDIAVAVTVDQSGVRPIHPLFAFLLSAAVPLFLGALLNDITYGNTAETQWA